MNHNCPACGEQTISSWRKFVAGALLPVQCRECGSIIEVSGLSWNIASFILNALLIFGIVWALIAAIRDPLYGAALFFVFVVSWVVFGIAATSFGRLSVGADNRFRESTPSASAGDEEKPLYLRLMSFGWLSSIACGAWVTSLFGLMVAMATNNIALPALCFAIIVFSGPVMRRLSPIVEQMHSCPACGKFTISTWSKLFPPIFHRPKCIECGAKWASGSGILGWFGVVLQLLLYAVLIASLYFQSFFPIILFGIVLAGMMMFDINFVPIVEHRKKSKANPSKLPPQ